MFEFYIAAREQKETGHPGIFSRQKHSTIIYVICLLLICLWFAGMVLVGGYARQLWVLWIVKAEVTVEAETPAFKQSKQFQKSHHLKTDGVVGFSTLVHLWQVAGESAYLYRDEANISPETTVKGK